MVLLVTYVSLTWCKETAATSSALADTGSILIASPAPPIVCLHKRLDTKGVLKEPEMMEENSPVMSLAQFRKI